MMLVPPATSLSDQVQTINGPDAPLISVVVPVYKEEGNIRPFLDRAVPVLERLGPYEIIFCLDPSPDATEASIVEEAARNPHIGLLVFSRRFGQPAATIAGTSIAAVTGARSSTSTCRILRKSSRRYGQGTGGSRRGHRPPRHPRG